MATPTLLVGNEISSVVEEAAFPQPPHNASSPQSPSAIVEEAASSQPPHNAFSPQPASAIVEEAASSQLQKEVEEHLHLVEAHRITLVKEEIGVRSRSQKFDWQNNYSRRVALKIQSSSRHSVTDSKSAITV
ncbi:hypothetical protein ABFS82_10G110200 [Erythranthe guttata]